jgi:hypothetical protein
MFCFRPLHADLSCPASYWFGEIGQDVRVPIPSAFATS